MGLYFAELTFIDLLRILQAEEGLDETAIACSNTAFESWKSPVYNKFDDCAYHFVLTKDSDCASARLVLKCKCKEEIKRRLRCKYKVVMIKGIDVIHIGQGHYDIKEGASEEVISSSIVDEKIRGFAILSGLTEITESIVEEKVTNEGSGTRLRLDDAFLDKKFSDVVLRPRSGEDVTAHRVLLAAASPVFDRAFGCESLEEKTEQDVVLVDASREAVVEMLRYIYTGRVGDFVQSSLYGEVLTVAEKYEVVELKTECERTLISAISAENAMRILQLADVYSMTRLKKKAVEFITSQMNGPKSVDEKRDILLNRFVSKCN